MSLEITKIVQQHLSDSISFNANDPLVNLSEESKGLHRVENELTFHLSDFPVKIIRESSRFSKETGSNSLCLTEGLISFELDKQSYKCPVFIEQLSFNKNRFENTLIFIPVDDSKILNPFLAKLLLNEFNFESNDKSEEEIILFLEMKVSKIERIRFIGNIHHHRYQVFSELEEMMIQNDYNHSFKMVLGENTKNTSLLKLNNGLIFPADRNHLEVFESFEKKNVVVQGPPGTGKSTLIANLISKSIFERKNVMVFSEKRAALEVLKKKLNAVGLGRFCFISSTNNSSKSLIENLKTNWNFCEQYEFSNEKDIQLSEQYMSQLEMVLELIENPSLIGGVSLRAFQEITKNFEVTEKYSPNALSVNEFNKIETELEGIYDFSLDKVIRILKPAVFLNVNYKDLETKLIQLKSDIKNLNSTFNFHSIFELKNVIQKTVKLQLIENDSCNEHLDILKPNSRKQKKFLSLRKKYLKEKKKLEAIQENKIEWKVAPNNEQLTTLKSLFDKTSFLAQWKAKRTWADFSKLPIDFAPNMIEFQENFNSINFNISQIKLEFCEIDIQNPDIEVYSLYPAIQKISLEDWEEIMKLPDLERRNLTNYHAQLLHVFKVYTSLFNDDSRDDINSNIETVLNSFEGLISHQSALEKLSQTQLIRVQRNTSFHVLKSEVLHSNWVNFTRRYSHFKDLSQEEIYTKVKEVLKFRNEEFQSFSRQIIEQVTKKYHYFQKLLVTPAHQLDSSEKELKKTLRKGKSILVKEFSKTKRFKTTRELYSSEANEWIKLLQPIWLSNSAQLAANIPLEKNVFDLCLFDEASQIPLTNALGALYRSERILVAGDSQQMGPSSYFKKQQDEPVLDLLHQASYNLEPHFLSHHYRSKDTQLIQFSNRHFYANRLLVFPAYSKSEKLGITSHFVEGGVFENRMNDIEALDVSKKVSEAIQKKSNFGLVAFSQAQLNCILSKLTATEVDYIQDSSDCFARSVENVQGDECDQLIISFGYGKDSDGNFEHRFGPMNQESGRNRLNVLLTRARESIDFYSSIKSSDFKITDNSSVELLKKWFLFIEQSSNSAKVNLPFKCDYSISKNIIEFKNISQYVRDSEELILMVSVLESRGWNLKFT